MGYVNLLSALLYIGISILTMALAYRVKALRTNTCEVGSRRGFTNRLYLIGIFIIFSIAQKYGYVKEEKHVRDLQTNTVPQHVS